MDHNEAWTILELEDGSTPDVVEAAFSRRNADLAQRIAVAVTPALRQKYEQQAERLRQARNRLLGDGRFQHTPAPLTLTPQRDLPAPMPIRSFVGGVGTGSDSSPLRAALGISHGQVLAERFEVRAHLGSGGMGAVFAAFDRVRDEEIAIKVLLPHLLTDPKARDRFLSEARIASSLSHANIVRVFDVHQTAGFTLLTMERLQGHSLRDEVARRQQTAERFSVTEVRGNAGPLCEALQSAHGQTVHRDVKPENIWLGEDCTVKLMDFGIARLLRPSQFTSTGLALGTAYYMAPEQLRGQEVDHRADQFAVGVILYELLAGEIPQGVIKAPHVVRRSVPAGMSGAVMKALEGRPEARHADMAALGRALASRSRGGVGMRAFVAATVAIFLGAIVTLSVWRTQSAGVRDDPLFASETPPAAAEVKAAYHTQWSQVEELKKQADAVGVQIESEVKKSPGEVAEQVADLWRRHPHRKGWLGQAEKFLASAKGLADKQSFDQAGADLKLAKAEYRKPQQWWTNARQALESIGKTRAGLEKRVSQFSDSPRVLVSWPEKLEAGVETKLLHGDGEEGLAEARRIAEQLTKLDELITLRHDVMRAAQGTEASAQVEGLRKRYDAAEARLQEADAALAEDRMGAAGRVYGVAVTDFQGVMAALTEHIDGLLAVGKLDLEAGRFDTALEQFQHILKLRPGDKAATILTQQAEIGLGIANAKTHIKAGEREQALVVLDELSKVAPNDAGVKSLRNSIYDPRRVITNSIGMKLVLIPAGEFLMGSPDGAGEGNEHPQHKVRINRPFYLGVCEVTQEEYEKVMGENPSWFSVRGEGKVTGQDTRRHPVETVSWEDAVLFCRKLSDREGQTYRLPTEAEWEYACRAGTTTRFSFGDDENALGQHAWFSANSNRQTHPVGEKKPNGFGLYDMHGNVWEWCWDGYDADYYKQLPAVDPRGPEQAAAWVMRGGCRDYDPRLARSAWRHYRRPESRDVDLGFRVARVPSER